MERTIQPDLFETPGAADRLPSTIWYMGAKTRVLPGFLDAVLEENVPPGGVVLDLFSGTGIVSAFCARRFRTLANDAQRYAQILVSSVIEHEPRDRDGFVKSLDFPSDLESTYHENRASLEEIYSEPLGAESQHLGELERFGGRCGNARRRVAGLVESVSGYREFLLAPGACYGQGEPSGLYAGAAGLISENSLRSYRAEPGRRPYCLITTYYANVYYGLRQAIELDSLRAAIDAIDPRDPFVERKRVHYLAALLRAASISTSGTSHFAQPRHLRKDSEIIAMARRRRIDVVDSFRAFSEEIRRVVASTELRPGNRALCGDYRALLDERNASPVFDEEVRADLVYMDPPYTNDHYSRFYHVLETVATYDYPELERNKSGEILRGRYPARSRRFQSAFCSSATVESEFERVLRAAAASGSKLVISYASPNGLLLKTYRGRDRGCDPVARLESLAKRSYRQVETRRRQLMHSGQGDSNIPTEELLVVCARPR